MTNERFHVIASRPAEMSTRLMQDSAKILGISAFDCRLRFATTLPRSLNVFASHDAAEEAARGLVDLGLTTVAFAEALLPPVAPVVVRRWQWLDDELNATDRTGSVGRLACAGLSDICIGRRTVVTKSMYLDKESHITTRGAHIQKTVVKHKVEKNLPAFMLLLPADLRQPALLFDADGLEFQCDPSLKGMSDMANLLTFSQQVIERCTDAVVDRTLLDQRAEPDLHKFSNRRIGLDPAVAVAFVLSLLRRAAASPDRFFSLCTI